MSPPQSPAQALISLPPGFDHLKPLEVVKMGARTSHPNPSLAIVTITIDASWCYVRGAGREPSPVLVRSDDANRECQPSPPTRKSSLSIGLRLLAAPGTASHTAPRTDYRGKGIIEIDDVEITSQPPRPAPSSRGL
jgi:hypothetical protein